MNFAILAGEKEYPNSDAIIVLDEGTVEVYVQSNMPFSVFEHHKLIRVLNERGKIYANIMIPYSDRSEVQGIEARTILPNGKTVLLDPLTIYDISLYPNFVFYSDHRAKIFAMPAVEDGALVEYWYQITIHDPTLWPEWSFQDLAPTLHSKFTLINPSEWEIQYRSHGNVAEPQVKKAPEGFKSTRVWDMKDITMLKTEVAMPPLHDLTTKIILAPAGIKIWNDVSAWFQSLWKTQMLANSEMKELVNQLTNNCSTEEEKLKNIFEWVRDNIRYIAVEIGIGGFQPHPAKDVLQNRYGDCKDITLLLCSLAQEAGINARPAFISTWSHGVTDTSLPSPLQFNHVIAYDSTKNGNSLWMDATDKGCIFQQLPWYDQSQATLLVHEDGSGEIKFTSQAPIAENSTTLQWNIELDSTGSARITGTSTCTGAIASEMRNELLYTSSENRRSWIETYLTKYCSGVYIDSFSIPGLRALRDTFQLSYSFHTTIFVQRNGKNWTMRPWLIETLDLPDYFRAEQRMHSVRFQFGEQARVITHIRLPQGFSHSIRNQTDSLVSSFGNSHWHWQMNGTTITTTKDYILYGKDILPENYREFQRFLDHIRERDLKEILLTQTE